MGGWDEQEDIWAGEIVQALAALNDDAIPFGDPEVQHLIYSLEESGFTDLANEILGWDWL